MHPDLKGDETSKKFIEEVTKLRSQGLDVQKIYNKLKLKNESLSAFASRLGKARVGGSSDTNVSSDVYPYQKPQNFNPKQVLDDYYFLGDLTLYGNKDDIWELKDVNGNVLTSLKANQSVQLSPIKLKTDENNTVYAAMQKYRINDGKKTAYVLSTNNKNLSKIHVSIEKDKNIITMYIGKPTVETKIKVPDSDGKEHNETVKVPAKGLKIIFDTNKFRDFLTQTFFYKLVQSQYKYPVVGFGLGFSIDPTKDSLINTGENSQVISLFNMKLIFKIKQRSSYIKPGRTNPKDIKMDIFYDSEPLVIQDKIKAKNYEEHIDYADLFQVGAVRIEPLNADDAKKIDNIK